MKPLDVIYNPSWNDIAVIIAEADGRYLVEIWEERTTSMKIEDVLTYWEKIGIL